MIFSPILPVRPSTGPCGPLGRHPSRALDTWPRHPAGAVKRKVQAAPASAGNHRVERARHRHLDVGFDPVDLCHLGEDSALNLLVEDVPAGNEIIADFPRRLAGPEAGCLPRPSHHRELHGEGNTLGIHGVFSTRTELRLALRLRRLSLTITCGAKRRRLDGLVRSHFGSPSTIGWIEGAAAVSQRTPRSRVRYPASHVQDG